MTKSPSLKSINAIRVIGEYMVFRLHVLHFSVGMDMFVRELMSFFVVLSGFSMMHRYYALNVSTNEEVKAFLIRRWWTVYPIYLFGWACSLPELIHLATNSQSSCGLHLFCSFMQMLMLDCWTGCSVHHTRDSLLWLIACLSWIWLAFFMLKETIILFFHTRVWLKMSLLGLISTAMVYPFREFDISATSALPLLRCGEFLIGCGAACALRQQKSIATMVDKWYWCPLVLSLGGMIAVYSILGSSHNMPFLCLQREIQSLSCSLWEKPAQSVNNIPPCYTTGEIFFNKNAMPWAIVIYCIAQAEVDGNTGVIMRSLDHDFFKVLHHFSLTLFVCHPALASAVKWGASLVLGWAPEEWQADALLLITYSMALLIHSAIQKVVSELRRKCAGGELCSSMPLIPLSDPIPDFDTNVPEEHLSTIMTPNEHCIESTNPDEY